MYNKAIKTTDQKHIMKYWVQFLIKSATDNAQLIDGCGSDAAMVLDGRLSAYNMNVAAMRQAQRLERLIRYPAFRIVSGPRWFEERRSSVVFKLAYPIQTN